LLGDPNEVATGFRAAEEAWAHAGRSERPRLVTGSFVALGAGAPDTLRTFAEAYLKVFSPELAADLAARMPLSDPGALTDLLDAVADSGCDEFIVVPATSEPGMLDTLAGVVDDWSSRR
jgi:hypothetical protein